MNQCYYTCNTPILITSDYNYLRNNKITSSLISQAALMFIHELINVYKHQADTNHISNNIFLAFLQN